MTKSANDSPAYRRFTAERNAALETFHVRAQRETTDALASFLTRALELTALRYRQMERRGFLSRDSRHLLNEIEQHIDQLSVGTSVRLYESILKMRRNAFSMAYVGEVEGLGRALVKPCKATLTKDVLKKAMDAETASGGQMLAAIDLALFRLRNRIVESVGRSRVLEETLDEMITRLGKKLPRLKRFQRPPKAVRKLREARYNPRGEQAGQIFGFVDEEQWDAMVSDYVDEYIPETRAPEFVYDKKVDRSEDLEEWYGWEIEQEITHDYVRAVRSGQVQAAKENGVKDFVWIAIIDSKTDDCCTWRNRLTSAEIEAELNGRHAGDECDALVPPAHFNCRCDLAPLLEGMPEESPPNFQEFDEWLNDVA